MGLIENDQHSIPRRLRHDTIRLRKKVLEYFHLSRAQNAESGLGNHGQPHGQEGADLVEAGKEGQVSRVVSAVRRA